MGRHLLPEVMGSITALSDWFCKREMRKIVFSEEDMMKKNQENRIPLAERMRPKQAAEFRSGKYSAREHFLRQ
jgi:hypothetical protein